MCTFVAERALLEDYICREHSRRVIRVLIYRRLTLQLYNHDFMHNILINAHDCIIFISNTTVPILFTTTLYQWPSGARALKHWIFILGNLIIVCCVGIFHG